MNNEGIVRSIWIKRVRLGPMDSADSATLIAGKGLVGNANQGGRRQVTLLEREVWDETTVGLGASIDPARRRANFLLEGVPLRDSRDRVLCIGECRIRIAGETKPCEQMEALFPGLQKALWPDWRGGAFGEVIQGGRVATGDAASWL